MNERQPAFTILKELLQHKVSLAQSMPVSADLSPMTKELCFGFCRHYLRLEAMALSLMDKRPKDIDIWTAILMGLYQLHYMNQPDYAVVKETVSLLGKRKGNWARGLVNGVLRQFCRNSASIISSLSNNPHFCLGQPTWLLEKLQSDWPYDWQNIAMANDEHPPMTLRVNTKYHSTDAYKILLKESGIEATLHPMAPEALTLVTPCNVKNLPGFAQGWVSVQDAAAQLAVQLLDLKPGLRILDACSAPGGKTSHILELQPNLEECLALDNEPRRLQRVEENLTRLGLKAKLLHADACLTQKWWDSKPFDRILLDAPCSATGVIRRHSDIKLLRTAEDIAQIVLLQKNLLDSLWPLLATNGLLVYATCSIMADENENQIRQFRRGHADSQVLEINAPWGRSTPHGRQILPGEQGMDGFFYSVIRKGL
mgnify:CR=1 FL=1